MTTVNRQSLNETIAEQQARLEALEAAGEVTPETRVLIDALLAKIKMLTVLLLEKKTRKTSSNSSLPPFEKTALAKSGNEGKGPKHDKGAYANVRLEVDQYTSEVDTCRQCGEDLSEVAAEAHQQRVLVDIEFVIRETRIDAEIKHCPNCVCVNRGTFTDLLTSQMVPLRRTAQLLKMITGCRVSEATLLKWVMRVHHRLAEWEDVAVEMLLKMPVMHADETSIRINRKKHWLHSCSGGDIVVKRRHPNRGAEAIDAIDIIPHCGSRGSGDDEAPRPVLVHDRWASYFKFNRCDRALCGTHLLRNLKYIEDKLDHTWTRIMRQLLLETDEKVLSEARCQEVAARFRVICEDGKEELSVRPPHQGKHGKIPKTDAENLLDAFVQYETEILRFAKCSEVPFTNNRAERDVRMSKVKQKVSGTFRNAVHADAYCRISIYLQSMSCQNLGSLAAIQTALNGKAVEMLGYSE